VATFNEKGWAIGRIHTGLGQSLSDEYEFVHYDWSNPDHVKELWADGGWKEYDIILGNGTLSDIPNLPREAYAKMICGIWSIPNLSSHFREIIIPRKEILWGSVGDDLSKYLKETYNIESHPIIAGVDEHLFHPYRKITKIRNLGMNGKPFANDGWDKVKRPQMMVDIADEIDGKAIFIHDKELSEGHLMYKDIDMYVCASTNDRGPYGIAEAAFSKIPVISTPVGFAKTFKSIKTFTSVEEAVKIIHELNSSEELLNDYVNKVYEEFTQKLSWQYVSQRYWKPLFEKRLSLNK